MKIGDIREMKTEELHSELRRIRRHLFDLRSQAVTEKLQDPTQLGKTRCDIARILTVLGERGDKDVEAQQVHLEAVISRGSA